MKYSYSYADWISGKILWNHIESNREKKEYISRECIELIESDQRDILKFQANEIETELIVSYVIEKRGDTNRENTLKLWFESVRNLYHGDIDSFNDTSFIFESQESNIHIISEEIDKKVIPPIRIEEFDKKEIEYIQNSYKAYKLNGNKWDFKVVQTPIVKDLALHIEYIGEVNAKAYLDFTNHLRKNNGDFINSLDTNIKEHNLSKIRAGLKKVKFIESNVSAKGFENLFQKKYILGVEKINWLVSKYAFKYFIQQVEKYSSKDKLNNKWSTVSNCFLLENQSIDSENIRKAKPIKQSSIEIDKIDEIFKKLKS